MFFFKRKNQDQEKDTNKQENVVAQASVAHLSDPVAGAAQASTGVKRVGSLARLARVENTTSRNSRLPSQNADRKLSFDERVEIARAKLRADAEARRKAQGDNLAKAQTAVGTTQKSSPINKLSNEELLQRLNKIGRPTDKTVILASARTNINRNPDAMPQHRRVAVAESQISDLQYHRFAVFLQSKSGIVLGEGKKYLVTSRLSSLVNKYKCDCMDTLITLVVEEKDRSLVDDAIDAMTTNETLWFRDTYPYLALQNIIIPDLIARGVDKQVRIWSAACSSGQEPYSIAITIQEMLGRMIHIDPSLVQIVGTDLSTEMLQHCRDGLYDAHALSRGLTAERRAKFFKPTHNPALMRIDPRVSRMVEFRPLNLLGSFALMGHFDVIFCRNVLIYFNNEVKRQILQRFLYCLNPGGYLILGSTETVTGVADKFEMIRCHPGIIYKLRN